MCSFGNFRSLYKRPVQRAPAVFGQVRVLYFHMQKYGRRLMQGAQVFGRRVTDGLLYKDP